MFKSYFTVAWRNLLRSKTFSVINILGLALGIACSLFIFLWVRDEVSIDRYHANGKHLYRVMERQIYDGKRAAQPGLPGLIAPEMAKKFPEIVYASGAEWEDLMTLEVGDKRNKEDGQWAGPDWFKMFSVTLLAGSSESALNAPDRLVLSRRLAVKYFGSVQGAMGKTVRIDDQRDYMVSAVYENLPANTSAPYDFVLSWDDYLSRNPWAREWGNNSPWAYVQLREDVNVPAFEAKIKHFLRGLDPDIDGKRYDVHLFLQPYGDTYLYSDQENGEISGGRIEYVRLFSVVAVFVLIIACINFMNLATARSVKRAKEVGIRKAVGADRSRLIAQFIGEALLLTLLAVLAAAFIISALLPAFNQLTGKQIEQPFSDPSFWLALLGLVLTTGLLSGSYPAFFLSSLQPVRVLKGTLRFTSGAVLFRQGLVVTQFGLSILLIVGTIVVYRQVSYIQTKNLGFDRENLLSVILEGQLLLKYPLLKQELQRMPGVGSVSRMTGSPHAIGNSTSGVDWPGKDPSVKIEFMQAAMGYDMAKTLGLKIIEGRDFSPLFATDSTAYIINEEAARRLGYQNPVDKPLTFWGKPGKIIGVVENFHFTSLHEPIQPLILRLNEEINWGNLLVRTEPGQIKLVLGHLETLCRKLNPKFPFTYRFVDQEYENLYKSEQVVGKLTTYFACLAIFIACLGLFGLVAFTAEQRTKEIGVRRVLGASVASVVVLLSGGFLRLVLISIVLASPVAWWASHKWLEGFAYKTDMTWWLFAVAGLLAIGIALVTVSFQSIKAALIDPVKSLRAE